MNNKKAKQMIVDVIRDSKCCGSCWWESTSEYKGGKYPNSILLIDGMNDIEYTFWYSPYKVSLTANQLRGIND